MIVRRVSSCSVLLVLSVDNPPSHRYNHRTFNIMCIFKMVEIFSFPVIAFPAYVVNYRVFTCYTDVYCHMGQTHKNYWVTRIIKFMDFFSLTIL